MAVIDSRHDRDLAHAVGACVLLHIVEHQFLVSLISIAKVRDKHLPRGLLAKELLVREVLRLAENSDRLLCLIL